MYNSIFDLIYNFLKLHNTQVEKEEMKLQLESHPDFPSLFSITELFNHFSINSSVYEVPVEENTLDYFENSFLAQIKKEKEEEIAIIKINGEIWEISTDGKKFEKIEKPEFLKIWTGICMVIEEVNFESSTNSQNKIVEYSKYFFLITGLIFFFIFGLNSILEYSQFSLSLIGLTFSILILFQELEINSTLGSKICNSENNTGCNSVIKSGMKILGFKMSDLTILYFSTSLISWIAFSLLNIQNFTLLFLISLLSFPIAFYSIYSQKIVLKQWCKLCLGIISILVIQAVIFLSFSDEILINSSFYNSLLIYSVIGILSMIIWYPIKNLLKKSQELQKTQISFTKFKRDFELFKLLSEKEVNYPVNKIENEIVLGNENGLLEILVVTNPLCGFCKKTHAAIEKVLNKKNENIRIVIRFNVNTNEIHDGNKIPLRLLELYHQNKESVLEPMHEIYSEGSNPKNWLQKWGATDNENFLEILKQEESWCKQNGITFTPLVLVDGKKFPDKFEYEDILYFIDELIEEKEEMLA
ncbi:vitamin K epoxide reductase family protein [Aureivirga marina]|uniref:vitamin K epoxide reductase family protein n=1 Tax=Aureivirga marina TaxID=1182451 RepID=UPI0018C9FE6D|nr:thioredoxin domain-containing protein [Aureivirga marina]